MPLVETDPQFTLFEPAAVRLPDGLAYEADWLSPADAARVIARIRALPFAPATYKAFTARRRIVSYGGRFDYDANRLQPAAPLVDHDAPELAELRDRVARWAGIAPGTLQHVLVSEYAPGTPLGWHRDVPDFEDVFGVSLGTPATLCFRPYRSGGAASGRPAAGSPATARPPRRVPSAAPSSAGIVANRGVATDDVIRLVAAPRSIYAIRGAARWDWQHAVAPVDALRWSITFRTLRTARRRRTGA